MTVGRRRKRYLLLTSRLPVDEGAKKELTRLILDRFPEAERKLTWLENGLIVKTDVEHLEAMKAGLALGAGEVRLETRSVSGSITKLKRMAQPGRR